MLKLNIHHMQILVVHSQTHVLHVHFKQGYWVGTCELISQCYGYNLIMKEHTCPSTSYVVWSTALTFNIAF